MLPPRKNRVRHANMSSSQLRTTLLADPRAVSIILGGLGVSSDALASYGRMYHAERQCSVVEACSPPLRFMRNQSLQPTARAVLAEAAKVLKGTPHTVPLVIHSFSNGGAFLLEEMENLLETEDSDDTKLLASRLKQGYQFFDSCPCYIRTIWDVSHLAASFPNRAWSPYGRSAYAVAASLSLTAWCTATLSLSRPSRFWSRMENSRACSHQIFVYTSADMLSDAAAVDRLIDVRRQSHGVTCSVRRYDDSGHCRLDKDHPEDYGRAIDDALAAACERSKGQR